MEDTKNRKLNLEDITSECVVQIEFCGLEFYKENIVPVYLLDSVICRAKNEDIIDSQDEESGISSNEETDSNEHLEEVEVENFKQEEHKEVSEQNEIKTKTLERQLVLEHKDEISLYNEESCVFNESARRQIEIEIEKLRELKMNEKRLINSIVLSNSTQDNELGTRMKSNSSICLGYQRISVTLQPKFGILQTMQSFLRIRNGTGSMPLISKGMTLP